MSKTHVVSLTINNKSGSALVYDDNWFDSGRLADGNSWPTTIAAGTTAQVQCCERDWSLVGCSGWVKYKINGTPLYFAFSNPSVGSNGIDIGLQTSVWDGMTSHYDSPVKRTLNAGSTGWLICDIQSSAGDNNQAVWNLTACDTTRVYEANTQLRDVVSIYNNFPTTPSRRGYYTCDPSPIALPALAESHFKGIASFNGKLIFTHTNLNPLTSPGNGRYLIADAITSGNQGSIQATYDTAHSGWPHPCSSQACGSFMAMGIQESASSPGSDTSEIQIYDIRMAQVNQPITLIGTIKRDKIGVNGVAMTKEAGPDGHYIIAAINGNVLTFYRSTSSSLLPACTFTELFTIENFSESGAGLALVTQEDGQIFLWAIDSEPGNVNSHIALYFVNLANQTCPQVGTTKAMPVDDMSKSVDLLGYYLTAIMVWNPVIGAALQVVYRTLGASQLNTSFRYGKGMAITSRDTIEIYASDRNTWGLSSIPLVGSDKDFGILVWANSPAPPSGKLSHYVGSYNTDTQWWGNYFDLRVGADDKVYVGGQEIAYTYDASSNAISFDWQQIKGTTAKGQFTFTGYGSSTTIQGSINPRPQDGPVGYSGTIIPNQPPTIREGGRYTIGSDWYLVLDGVLRHIPNPTTYNNLFRDWSGAIALATTPDPAYMGPDLTNLAYLARGSSPEIYLISDGVKRWIPTPATFDAFWFNWNTIRIVPQPQLDAITTGEALTVLG